MKNIIPSGGSSPSFLATFAPELMEQYNKLKEKADEEGDFISQAEVVKIAIHICQVGLSAERNNIIKSGKTGGVVNIKKVSPNEIAADK
jgi:hypothetical protein